MGKFRYYELEVEGNSCPCFRYEDDIAQDPENAIFWKAARAIRKKVKESKEIWTDAKHNPRHSWCRKCYARAGLWVFCLMLYYYGHDNEENRQELKDFMDYWELDESLVFEMKDIIEGYKMLSPYVQPCVYGKYNQDLTGKPKFDKKVLDESIKALVTLG